MIPLQAKLEWLLKIYISGMSKKEAENYIKYDMPLFDKQLLDEFHLELVKLLRTLNIKENTPEVMMIIAWNWFIQGKLELLEKYKGVLIC